MRGLVLAAGAGTRYGGPKALARDGDGVPWVERVVVALHDGGCDDVVVVLGAQASRARALVPRGTAVVEAEQWERGLAHSLAAGLDHVLDHELAAAGEGARPSGALAVVPVDVPGMPGAAVARVLGAARGPAALVRATCGGTPSHPVVLGADHWAPLRARLPGPRPDAGAGPHLDALAAAAGAAVTRVECGDLWDGHDVDALPGS